MGCELAECRPAAAPAGERIGELPAHLLDQARTQQEVECLLRLVREHLAQEVVAHATVVAGKALQERSGIRSPFQRERREPHSGRPSPGALQQQVQLAVVQLDAGFLAHRTGLVRSEGEVGGAYLPQAAGQAQSLQAQRRVDTSREDQPKR
jgi:hypothetical protein